MATSITSTDDFGASASGQAVRVIQRWREQGFDAVLCHPSGYCSPANSSTLTTTLREGYHVVRVDSAEAIEAVDRSIAAGIPYRA